jgi:hypothetical protein
MKLFLNIVAVISIIGGLLFVGNYALSPVLKDEFSPNWANKSPAPSAPQVDKSKEVQLQEVNNLGYTFYLGQIDNSNNIDDNFKTEITKIVYSAHFPESILKNTPIVIINSLALKDGLYIPTSSGNLNVGSFGPSFLYEGGIYAKYNGGGAVIFINKTTLDKGLLVDVLTHELGHAIGNTLSDTDWKKYYGLRNIPATTKRDGSGLWNLSPQEDFAEVYKNTFTGLEVRTYYGLLTPTLGTDGITSPCYKIYQDLYDNYRPKIDSSDPTAWLKSITTPDKTDYNAIEAKVNIDSTLQDCRRNIMSNQSQYPNDFQYGMAPYKSTVGPQTKEFINSVTNGIK